jgi:hypothetical protein
MTIRMWTVIATVWILSLIGLATLTHAQAPSSPAADAQRKPALRVISGSDIGFVVDKDNGPGGILAGRWMVKIDGQWRHVTGERNVVPLATR